MKILFAYRALNDVAGGLQRMIVALMNEMVRQGYDVELLTWDKPDSGSFFALDDSIKWHRIHIGDHKKRAGWQTRWQRLVTVRKTVRSIRPDVIIGYQDGMFMAMRFYTMGMDIPVIAAERNAPSRFDHIQSKYYKTILFQAFRLAAAITIQCESYRAAYPRFLHHKIVTIPNPVTPATVFARPFEGGDKVLLSVGRLGYQKNYDVLVKAFAKISSDFAEWRLVIVGEGEDRKKIEALVVELGLSEKVSLPGTTSDVASFYSGSHLFCLPSRWEGFPNALAEALSHGLPAVGFAGTAGVSDLIVSGVNGLLADGNGDVDALAQALSDLMKDESARKQYGQAAVESMSIYEPEIVYAQWGRLFSSYRADRVDG